MKWIGQHIVDLIARFKGAVYLEDVSTGTIASGSNLGLDANNKIVKASASGGISFDGSTANGVLSYKDADEASVEANLTFLNNSNISTLSLLSNQDTGDYFSLATTTHGATTLTTIDDDATAAHFEIAADGNITLDAAAAMNLEIADDENLDFKNGSNTFARLNPESGSGTDFSIFERGGDSQDDYCNIAVTEHGATQITTNDAAAAAANLTISVDGQFSVASTGIDIAGNGTITNATWNGTAIASAYLDADTAHYSAQRQLTYYMFRADIDTTKTYVGLQEAEGESSTSTNKNLPILAPVAGKLLKVFLRATTDVSSNTFTWRLETQDTSSNTGAAPSVIGTQSGAGCSRQNMATYDFTTSLDSGTNVIGAGDTVQLSIESDSTTANTTYYITCMWEWNLS